MNRWRVYAMGGLLLFLAGCAGFRLTFGLSTAGVTVGWELVEQEDANDNSNSE